MNRTERITFDQQDLLMRGKSNLGALRRFLRELSDWPDDAAIYADRLEALRPLPLVTAAEGPADD